jgi:ABC-2 type transport system permease protein
MIRRFLAIFVARNKEFYRDRAAFGWNFLFPFLIILGFALMFQRGGQQQFRVGLIPHVPAQNGCGAVAEKFGKIDLFKLIVFEDPATALEKLKRHRLDMVIECGSEPTRYWIADSSPKGRISESLLLSEISTLRGIDHLALRQVLPGERIDYIDWLFPGIIGMNMMFSALFGVGYVVVRYRKSDVLKRFKATPLTPFEYLSAQVASRMVVLLFTNSIVYIGCAAIFDFHCKGSYLDLILMFALGCASIISLGLVIAARSSSEEFANGVLNFISWPMMFLSEVWFSLEGAPEWIRTLAKIFPLSHVTEGMRRIMIDGAPLSELTVHVAALAGMTLFFMLIGSALFKWTED